MLSFVVICCLVSSQVWGAAVLNNAHAAAKEAHDYADRSAHHDNSYSENHNIKDSAYAYEKGSGSGETDGHAVAGYNGVHHAAAPYGYGGHHAAAGYGHQGAYLDGHNSYDYSFDRGQGYNHEESDSKEYNFNEDYANKGGDYYAASHNGYNNGYPAVPYYNYAASPFLHTLHKRNAGYGYNYPAYGYGYNNHYGHNYPASGYGYNNYGHNYPASGYGYNHHAYKRSAGYGYSAYPARYGYNGYYGNHYNGNYGNHNGYGHGYPAYRYGSYGHH